jgi:hypothetical protein
VPECRRSEGRGFIALAEDHEERCELILGRSEAHAGDALRQLERLLRPSPDISILIRNFRHRRGLRGWQIPRGVANVLRFGDQFGKEITKRSYSFQEFQPSGIKAPFWLSGHPEIPDLLPPALTKR